MITAADLLREARAVYEANPSHAPAGEWPCEGEDCPLTAASTTARRRRVPADLENEAYRTLAAGMRCEYSGIPQWNAEHSTAEVLEAFDRAITLAEAS